MSRIASKNNNKTEPQTVPLTQTTTAHHKRSSHDRCHMFTLLNWMSLSKIPFFGAIGTGTFYGLNLHVSYNWAMTTMPPCRNPYRSDSIASVTYRDIHGQPVSIAENVQVRVR
jgi:hypothetical protein